MRIIRPLAKFLQRVRPATITPWLQQHSPLWPGALGVILGSGIGIGALFGITGVAGMGLCLLVIAGALWRAWDAEPVLVGLEVKPEPQTEEIPTVIEREPEPLFVEQLDMVELPGGTFLMGSPDSDREAFDNEKPQHQVTIAAFAISRYPITRQLYREIVGAAPEQWERNKGEQNLPANYVSWFDAARFCNALSTQVGLSPCYRIDGDNVEWNRQAEGYRLPTEVEWEYACRAGATSKRFFGDDPHELGDYAWFSDNSGGRVHPVGEKKPNPWDLHDMIGNVWEWCWDWFADYLSNATQTIADPTGPEHGNSRVLRGGSWGSVPWFLWSAFRFWFWPEFRHVVVGFRCVRAPRR